MELVIIQQPTEAFLKHGAAINLIASYNGTTFTLTVEDNTARRITVSPTGEATYLDTLRAFYDLEKLLMAFDGQFHNVVQAYENRTDITISWKDRALASFETAHFMVCEDSLLDFHSVLNNTVFSKWRKLQNQLDMIHKMVLYCVSSVQMPIDMKCAFMIEAFLGIAEILKGRQLISLPEVSSDESKLGKYLQAVIEKYGKDIFTAELATNITAFVQVLVNSRNRIAHIKNRQSKLVLNGKECEVYLKKLFLIYRSILLVLLKVPYESYKPRLLQLIKAIDEQPATKEFLLKIKNKPVSKKQRM